MKFFLVFALLGSLFFLTVQGRPADGDAAAAPAEGSDEEKGVAGFPVSSLGGKDLKDKVEKLVKTLNTYAQSSSAYTAEQSGKLMKITGNVVVTTKDGEKDKYDSVLIDGWGKVYSEPGKPIQGAVGIIGGEENRLMNLSDDALEKIKDALKKGQAVLSALPNDVWVFGKPSFDQTATVSANTATILKDLGNNLLSGSTPLNQANSNDLSKLIASGIDLAVQPAKIIAQGAGKGINAAGMMASAAIGTPLALGSNVARAGADLVSNGAEFFGRIADGFGGIGRNLAGIR